jgi:hypothetical protein
VEPRVFEPLTSAEKRRRDTLLNPSGVCKRAAKTFNLTSMLFPSFQVIYSGCCTLLPVVGTSGYGRPLYHFVEELLPSPYSRKHKKGV